MNHINDLPQTEYVKFTRCTSS